MHRINSVAYETMYGLRFGQKFEFNLGCIEKKSDREVDLDVC